MKNNLGNLFMLGFKGPELPNWLSDFEAEYGLGGCILFDYCCTTKTYKNNIENKEQLKKLNNSIHKLPSRPLVFIDQEGGKVRRLKESLGFAPLPSQAKLAALPVPERAQLLRTSFSEMRRLGIAFDLAPVVDLNINPNNPNIGAIERSYSVDVHVVKENVEIVNAIAKETNLGLCLKHYPGLGGAKVDSHLELTDISDTVNSAEEELFFELAPDLSGNAILLSHGIVRQWDSKNPVSMSKAAVSRIRAKLPSTLLITDDLQMQGLLKHYTIGEAAIQGLRAGVDLILIGNNLLGEEKNLHEIMSRLQTEVDTDAELRGNVTRSLQRIEQRKARFGFV